MAVRRFPSHLALFWLFDAIPAHQRPLVICRLAFTYSILAWLLGSLVFTWCSRLTSQRPASHSSPPWPPGIRTIDPSRLLCVCCACAYSFHFWTPTSLGDREYWRESPFNCRSEILGEVLCKVSSEKRLFAESTTGAAGQISNN